ncbi:MAG: zinc ribbon domain-containing protein, partial [Dehalococcoidia bacterium]|nr:zinc ribbon domain-containing protein [Dehalococcoidia bacterium]
MPIYEYRCSGCGARFELMRPMSRAQEEAHCPTCKRPSRRVPSRFASVA